MQQITKQGGSNDITFVSLDIDGRNVANLSYAAAENWGLTPTKSLWNSAAQVRRAKDADHWLSLPFALQFRAKADSYR